MDLGLFFCYPYDNLIASQCGLDRNLSFQSARSTFAVTIGIANK